MTPPTDLPLFANNYRPADETAALLGFSDKAFPSGNEGSAAAVKPYELGVDYDRVSGATENSDPDHQDRAVFAAEVSNDFPEDAYAASSAQAEPHPAGHATSDTAVVCSDTDGSDSVADAGVLVPVTADTTDADHRALRPIGERPQTLCAALAEITAQATLGAEALRHVTSDLRMAAKVTGVPLDRLPCMPVELRPILKGVKHARHNMTLSRWSTIKSSIARLLKLTGWVDHDGDQIILLTEAWQRGIDRIPQQGQRASLMGFARFCIAQGIEPEVVSLNTIENYGQWRRERTLTLDVTHVASAVRRVWRYLQQHDPEWPQAHIPAARDPRRISLLPTDFPASLVAEVDQVIQNLAIIKPLDPRFRKRYSPYTIACTRNTIYRAATAVAAALGGTDKILTLRDVVAPGPLGIAMNEHFVRVGGDESWAPSAKTHVITLKRVAVASGTITEQELNEIADIVELVGRTGGSLSKRSRDRVAQFHDPELLAALARLPDRLFKEADKFQAGGLTDRAARLYSRGLQLAILLVNPLRRKSLATLDIERHFTRDRSGTINRLYIAAGEMKNASTIEASIPSELSRRIAVYLRDYRQVFRNAESTFLFPGGDDGHVSPCTVARNLKELVERDLGADFNVHLVRHIMATLLVADDPRNIILAQQLLGHRDGKTTERIYGHTRTHAAQKAWGETLERRVAKINNGKKKADNPLAHRKGKRASDSVDAGRNKAAGKRPQSRTDNPGQPVSQSVETSQPTASHAVIREAAANSRGANHE